MAMEKALYPAPEGEELENAIELEVLPEEEAEVETDADGNVVITFGSDPEEMPVDDVPFDDNLAEYYDDTELMELASDLVQGFVDDQKSREDWAKAYIKGLDLLGLKIEERSQPWEGAAGVFHPLLIESVIRFQAQAMGELFPASGPARTKTVGEGSTEKTRRAGRVEDELNYLLTEEMEEYRDELEQMLFRLPLAGSSFKKVYFDSLRKRPVAVFVPAEDFVLSYGASNLSTCDRYTHVMRENESDVAKLQLSGFYRDVELSEPTAEYSDIQEKYNDLSGTKGLLEEDDRRMILEMHVSLDLPAPFDDPDGIARPYIVSIDKTTSTVLAIRRNWYEGDENTQKRAHFVHYRYLPGLGFYGTGLIHILGGLTKAATAILRQLIDAGTLSNLPAGLKARGMRIKGDDTPLRPGEFRDVDVIGSTIRDSIYPLPIKEPSTVLHQLLTNLVDEGRRIGSVADVKFDNMNAEAPVGTTLALMERSLKVMSGVQARLHAAQKTELRLIARVVHDYMPDEYAYDVEEGATRGEDFDGRVDVIPVSDPNASTKAQRVMQHQAALQLAQGAPHLYNMGMLHRQMLEALDIPNAEDIVALEDDLAPKDPVAENMCILKQEAVRAFQYQDHEAHITTHMAAAQDPKILQIVGQSPFASAIQSAMAAHITEHVAMQYRVEMEKALGTSMPDPDEPLPEDVELALSRVVAEAASKVLGKSQAEAQQQQAEEQANDPLTQIQMRELAISEKEVGIKETRSQHDMSMDMKKHDLNAMVEENKLVLAEERLRSEDKRVGAQIGARIATQLDAEQRKDKREGAKLGVEIARELYTDAENREADSKARKMNDLTKGGDNV